MLTLTTNQRPKALMRVGSAYRGKLKVMATKTTTKTEEKPKIVATVIAAVVTLIKEWTGIKEKGDAIQLKIADTIADFADKQGLDKSEVRPYVVLTYRAAFGMDKETDKAKLLDFDRVKMGDVSRVMTLAFPASPQAARDLEKAREHNKTANGDRIGIHKLISVAGGRATTSDILKKKTASKEKGKASYPLSSLTDDIAGNLSRYVRTNSAKLGGQVKAVAKASEAVETLLEEWAEKAEAADKEGSDDEKSDD